MASHRRKYDDLERHIYPGFRRPEEDRWVRQDIVNMELDLMAKDVVELRSLCRQLKRNLTDSEGTVTRSRDEVRFVRMQNDTLRDQLAEYRRDLHRQTIRNIALERENDELWKTLRRANVTQVDQLLDSMDDFKRRLRERHY